MRSIIRTAITKAIYYTIIIDSTPDITKKDQFTFLIRYVDVQSDLIPKIKESFIKFFTIENKNAESIYLAIKNIFLESKIDFKNCVGQIYDNAATFAGHISGVAKRLTYENKQTALINCCNHSLCLSTKQAAELDNTTKYFFMLI